MNDENRYTVWKFFHLSDEIKRLSDIKEDYRREFWAQSFTGQTYLDSVTNEIKMHAPRMENEILNYISNVEALEKRIERLKNKRRLFSMWLNTLEPSERLQLADYAENGADLDDTAFSRVFMVISDISVAVCGQPFIKESEYETAVHLRNGTHPKQPHWTRKDELDLTYRGIFST